MLVVMACTMSIAAPITIVGGVIMAAAPGRRRCRSSSWSRSRCCGVVVGLVIVADGARSSGSMQERIDQVNRVLREQITGIRVVRAFVREPRGGERLRTAPTTTSPTVSLRAGRLMASMFPTVILVINVVERRRCSGSAPTASPPARCRSARSSRSSRYLMQILMSVMMATFMIVDDPARLGVGRSHPGGARHRLVDGRRPPTRCRSRHVAESASLEFRDVEFHYPGAEHRCSATSRFTAAPGETDRDHRQHRRRARRRWSTSSRGCSTAPAGTVLVDGVDVRDLDPDVLWSRIGLVPQKPYLFSGTVASNLRYGKPDATDDELWAGARDRPGARLRRRRCPAGSTPRSRRAAPTCPAASGSGSRSPGRSCASPTSTSSTTRSRRSTSRPTRDLRAALAPVHRRRRRDHRRPAGLHDHRRRPDPRARGRPRRSASARTTSCSSAVRPTPRSSQSQLGAEEAA